MVLSEQSCSPWSLRRQDDATVMGSIVPCAVCAEVDRLRRPVLQVRSCRSQDLITTAQFAVETERNGSWKVVYFSISHCDINTQTAETDLLYSSWVVVSLDSTVHPTTIVASCPCIRHQLPLQKTRTMPLLFPVGRLNITSPAPKGWDLTNQALSECMTPLYPDSSL